MGFDRFLIAPINTGLQTNLKSWLTPEDSFEQMQNAYVFRGRIRKRFGSKYTGVTTNEFMRPYFSRLRIPLTPMTDGSGNASGTIPTGSIPAIGQSFSIGTQVFTANLASGALLASAGTGTGTYDTTTGAYTFAGATPGTTIYFYMSQPVMGLGQVQSSQAASLNDNPSLAFDTRWAYTYNGSWNLSPGGGPWHGDDTNLFWTANWYGSDVSKDMLYVSNFYVLNTNGNGDATDDFMWRYDAFNPFGPTWTEIKGVNGFYTNPGLTNPPFSGPFIVTARIIVPFKNHLILLNTIENDGVFGGATPLGTNTQYPFRCRYSWYGDPLVSYAWYENNSQDNANGIGRGGGFIDAATQEEIIGAEFIKDRLIVYFEQSTWEMVWTGNNVVPFLWQKINTELGASATFSTVPFDKQALAVDRVGIHACSGANVQRIDEKIPDEIFSFNKQAEEVVRVVGIRDYFTEVVYWTFPTATATRYPNQIMVYNYRNNTWSFNDDCITFFGYFDQQIDTTWEVSFDTWEDSEEDWQSGIVEANMKQVLAGNQQGFVFIIDPDENRNAAVMTVTNMVQTGNSVTLTIIDHTLQPESPLGPDANYITIENLPVGFTVNDVNGIPQTIWQVNAIPTDNTITIANAFLSGVYSGGATVARVSNIQILSKQWNPYVNKGTNFYLARIDFCVEKTSGGQITVDYYPSGSSLSMLTEGGYGTTGTKMLMGNGVLETSPYDPAIYPFEQYQQQLWHPIYFQTDGEFVQIKLFFTDAQIRNQLIAFSPFDLQGMVLHVQNTSMRLQ